MPTQINLYVEDDHDLSIDNSRRVVGSFPNAVYYCYPKLIEIEKRLLVVEM